MAGSTGSAGGAPAAPRPVARPSWAGSTPRRLGVLVIGLVCMLGLLSGMALPGRDAVQHRAHHRVHAASVASVIVDGHGATGRGDQHGVAAASVTGSPPLRRVDGADAAAVSTGTATVDTVRTRGPPASR